MADLTMARLEACKKAALLIESCETAIDRLENFLHDLHLWAEDSYEIPDWQWEHHRRGLFLSGLAGESTDWRQMTIEGRCRTPEEAGAA